jgi:hypothetical protein
MNLTLALTPETFDIGSWHPEMGDDEVFLGVVPPFVFDMMGWVTKRQGIVVNGEGPAFVARTEMIDEARACGSPGRGVLLKTLLKTERAKKAAGRV